MKKLNVFLLLFFIGSVIVYQVEALSDDEFTVRNFQPFNVYLHASILFQLDNVQYSYVALEPLNDTVINGTSCSLWIAPSYGGKFEFDALENAVVQVNAEMSDIGNVRFNGVGAGDGSQFNVLSGNTYTLEWSYTVAPLISMALILGIMGCGMSLGGPFYIISKWRDEHDVKGMITGTVIMLVGFALLLGWLFT